jgi:hypothetical protein
MKPTPGGSEEVHVDCAQFKEIVHDMDRADTQGFALRASALDHAEECSECSALLNDVEALDFALNRMAEQDAEQQAPAGVEAALLNEFRRQRATAVMPQRNFRIAALGIAAGFVLLLGLSLRHWIMPVPNGPAVGASGGRTIAANAQSGGATTTGGDETASMDEDATNSTDFVSLPYAADPATLEDATIVRVTLSRSALASFGVPVADMDAAEQIPADIALSEDGSPQAIRLVSAETTEQSY